MPVLSLQPWSQFSRPDDEAPQTPGTIVFHGGPPMPLILRAHGGSGLLELEQAVEIDGTAYPCGAVVGTPALAGSAGGQAGHVLTIDEVAVGIAPGPDQVLAAGDLLDIALAPEGGQPRTEPHDGILCFAAGTQIDTPAGPRRVETLRPGEILTTEDHGPMPLLWTGRREVLFAKGDDRFRPIQFKPGSLGPNSPTRDLVVAPHHHLVLRGPDVAELTGNTAALAPAGALTELRGVRQMLGKRRITYVHLMLEGHAVLRAEGAECESFYPTPVALAGLGDDQRAAVFAHVPALRIAPETAFGPTALPMIGWAETRALAAARKARSKAAEDLPMAAE
ncbi:Hint domain-containing protein [Marinibacterium sp. SX1]|uniref:Hint domain-containing protein n=1 Tax=Marinibacterium sp. SX1 TaxID=3388424 RepID=UPI003D17ADA8